MLFNRLFHLEFCRMLFYTEDFFYKEQACKPGSVTELNRLLVIYLSGLPPGKGGQPLAPVYMALQLVRQAACIITNTPGGLLHPLLTLTA